MGHQQFSRGYSFYDVSRLYCMIISENEDAADQSAMLHIAHGC
jgi:hypothetical protein